MPPPRQKDNPRASLRWVLDANILYSAAGEDSHAVLLLLSIKVHDRLGLDEEWAIDKEYGPALEHPIVGDWFWSMYNEGRCKRYASDLPTDCEKEFRKQKFHNDDWKYVGVAMRTEDRLVVTEDLGEHDFCPTICDYLKKTFDMRVLCLEEACKRAQSET